MKFKAFPLGLSLLLVCFVSAIQPAAAQSTSPSKSDSDNPIEALLNFAERHLHSPYRSGGMSKKGFDCSGFVRYCYEKWNVLLPHSSSAQANKGKEVALEEAQPGDLIFFKGSSVKSSQVGHVGIITEVNSRYVRFIHSAFKGGVRYDVLNSAYYKQRFVAIRRVLLP